MSFSYLLSFLQIKSLSATFLLHRRSCNLPTSLLRAPFFMLFSLFIGLTLSLGYKKAHIPPTTFRERSMRCILVLLLCCFFLFCFVLGFGQYESISSALFFSAQQYLHFVHRLWGIITVLCYHICIYLSTVVLFFTLFEKSLAKTLHLGSVRGRIV